MESIREEIKKQGNLLGFIAKYDILWDSLTCSSDYTFSNINDYLTNSAIVPDGRSFIFKELKYFKKTDYLFTLKDDTGELETRLIYEVEKYKKLLSYFTSNSLKKRIETLENSSLIQNVCLRHIKGINYLVDFKNNQLRL